MGTMYCTVAELRAEMNLAATTDDAILERLIEAASRSIDRACNRVPDGLRAGTVALARYYIGNGRSYMPIHDCVEITALAVKGSLTGTTYEAWSSPSANMAGDGDWYAFTGSPDARDLVSLPYTHIAVDINGEYSIFTSGAGHTPTVQVTARWGYADDTPADIKLATIMLCARWYKLVQGAMSDTIASTDFGGLLYRQSLHPDIRRILIDGRYVRPNLMM